MKKSYYSIYGLTEEAAQVLIAMAMAANPAELEIVGYTYDAEHKTLFFEVVRQEGESNYHMNNRFRRLTGIKQFVAHKDYPCWYKAHASHEAPKPQPKRRGFFGFLKFIIDYIF